MELFVSAIAMTDRQCPVAFTSKIVGGKWRARIVWALFRRGVLRYAEIRRACPPISDRILSKELKELELCGLVERQEYANIPPRTEYSLTKFGRTLHPILEAMAEWGDSAQDRMSKAPEIAGP